jgi:hypothetical protein
VPRKVPPGCEFEDVPAVCATALLAGSRLVTSTKRVNEAFRDHLKNIKPSSQKQQAQPPWRLRNGTDTGANSGAAAFPVI